MAKKKTRTLIVIGGREDKIGDRLILSEVARRVGSGKLVIAVVASKYPGPLFEEYDRVFRALGIKHVEKLGIHNRCEANDQTKIRVLDDAAGVFFTGGDQLRITSQLGDTPVHKRIKDIYESNGLIAGTSAGASVMCETMIVSSGNPDSHKVKDSIKLAPGFGLIGGMIIDQHFSERSRMVRLLGSIAQNPKNLGLGIDEQNRKFIEAALSSNTSSVGVDIAGNKELTKRLLDDASIPVPQGEIVEDEETAIKALVVIAAPRRLW